MQLGEATSSAPLDVVSPASSGAGASYCPLGCRQIKEGTPSPHNYTAETEKASGRRTGYGRG